LAESCTSIPLKGFEVPIYKLMRGRRGGGVIRKLFSKK